MDKKISIYEVMEELKQMENDLIKERKEHKGRRKSTFSYWLYERKVREYQANRPGNYDDMIIKRMEDIVHQHQINMDEEAYDRKQKEWSLETIKKVENLRKMLND